MRYLQQRVPLGMLKEDGRTVEINREFGDQIEALLSIVQTASDLGAVLAAISVLQSSISTLTADLSSLEERVRKLEGGYQS